MCRKLCNHMWIPRVREKGILLSTLKDFNNCNSRWRDTHLSKLGVPTQWPEAWDFLAAITACSTDVYYHCLWLVVARAIKDYGVVELKQKDQGDHSPLPHDIDAVLQRYKEESDHGAMRIAALASLILNDAESPIC